MKIIKSSFEILPQSEGLNGIYKQIEMAGRTCYKSEDKITETSAKEFAERMIKSGHGAMLEHGTVYLYIPYTRYTGNSSCKTAAKYKENKYSKVHERHKDFSVTTNYRVLVENNWLKDLQYICEPTNLHERRLCVKFVCDRGVSHELVRHRVFSFAQESTRYCNYSKEKFGNALTFIYPCWFSKFFEENYTNKNITDWQEGIDVACSETNWLYAMLYSEKSYFASLKNGVVPQQARSVLPNSLKTEIVMTGFKSDWYHFFKLRTADTAHPQMRELAIPLAEELIFCKNECTL